MKGRQRLRVLAGQDIARIIAPVSSHMLQYLMQTSLDFQTALVDFPGHLDNHNPSHKLSQRNFILYETLNRSHIPLSALTVSTDGSGRTGRAVIVWKDPCTQTWLSDINHANGSPLIVELAAVARAFQLWQEPLSIVTDSAYVARLISHLENACLRDVSHPLLFHYLFQLSRLLNDRKEPYFTMHIRVHTTLPGPLVEGNR